MLDYGRKIGSPKRRKMTFRERGQMLEKGAVNWLAGVPASHRYLVFDMIPSSYSNTSII